MKSDVEQKRDLIRLKEKQIKVIQNEIETIKEGLCLSGERKCERNYKLNS